MEHGAVFRLVQTAYGPLRAFDFRDPVSGTDYVALLQGQVAGPDPVTVRLHAGPGDLVSPTPELARKLRRVARARKAVLVCARGRASAEASAGRGLRELFMKLEIRRVIWPGKAEEASCLRAAGVKVLVPEQVAQPVWLGPGARYQRRVASGD